MKKLQPEPVGDARLRRSIVLIGLIGALPLFFVALLLINVAYSTPIEFGVQEQRGIVFQRLIEGVLEALPRYAAARRAAAAGGPSSDLSAAEHEVDAALRKLSAAYDGELGRELDFTAPALRSKGYSDAELGALQKSWSELLQTPAAVAVAPESIGRVATGLRAMSTYAGDSSNLILDPDLDSFDLSDMTLTLPHAQARLLEIAAREGARRSQPPLENGKQLAILAALVREADLTRLESDARGALSEDAHFNGMSPSLQANLPAASANYAAATERLLKLLAQLSGGANVASQEFEAAEADAELASERLFRTSVDELDRLLATRLRAIRAKRASASAIILATLLGAAAAMAFLIRGLLAARYAEMLAAQEELRAKEAQLRALGDNLPGGMTYQVLRELDGRMRFLYVSAGVERLHGVSVDAVLADSSQLYRLVADEDRPALEAAERESLATMQPFRALVRSRRASDGATRWLELASAPRALSDGRVVWDGIQMDVTERKLAEAATRQSQERFTHIFDHSPIPITLNSFEDGKFLAANESFLRFSEFSREEVLGKDSDELGLYLDSELRQRIRSDLRAHGRVHGVEIPFRTKSGARRANVLWVEVITIDAQKYILAMSLDVTEQQEATRQQRQLEEQLRQTQKLEALGTLAGGIAHDFNNILGAIISYTELSKLDYPDNVPLNQNLDEVLHASRRATALVRQILLFSRRQKDERRNMRLAPIVKEALSLLRATLPATIVIEHVLDRPVSDVLVNATHVHQIVMNLCTNAGHAIQGKGKLSLEIDQVEVQDGPNKPHVELKEGEYVRLTISDTGHGMDAATMQRIFEPFFTTKEAGEGTGLGLSVVHGIVHEYGGVVTVDSELGRGTTFAIYLPASSRAQALPGPDNLEAPRGNGQRVLFVDDEAVLGDAAHKMLTRLGYSPVVFRSSVEALSSLRKDPDGYAALVTDFTMPELTGLELIREALAMRTSLPVILASGSTSQLNSEQLHQLGVHEVLTKPVSYVALARALHRLLSG